MAEAVDLAAADGAPLLADWHRPAAGPRMAVLLGGGLGIPRSFYSPLAQWLAGEGHAVLVPDYRGIGGSGAGLDPRDMRMAHWGQHDLEGGLRWLRHRYPGTPLGYIGHSGGGQLLGLAPSARELAAAVFVATQHGWSGHWPWPWRAGLWLLWHALLPAGARVHPMFPARALRLSVVDVPSGVIREWAAWGRRRDYLFDAASGLDTSGYAALRLPVTSLEVEGDRYAPPRAAAALLAKYAGCPVEREALPAELGHFGLFRRRASAHWPRVLAGLARGEGRGTAGPDREPRA